MHNPNRWTEKDDEFLLVFGLVYPAWQDVQRLFLPHRSAMALSSRFSAISNTEQKAQRYYLMNGKTQPPAYDDATLQPESQDDNVTQLTMDLRPMVTRKKRWTQAEVDIVVHMGLRYRSWDVIRNRFLSHREPHALQCKFTTACTPQQKEQRAMLTQSKGFVDDEVLPAKDDGADIWCFEDDARAARPAVRYRDLPKDGHISSSLGGSTYGA